MTWEWESDRRENPPDRPYNRNLPEGTHVLLARMAEYLEARGLCFRLARRNWWYGSYCAGDRAPRIVIPATSKIPGNVYWQARAMDDNPKRYMSPLAPRGDAVVAVWPFNKEIVRSVVVEGPMDALAAAETGCLGVALMGATPSQDALNLTATLVCGTICSVVADMDAQEPAVGFARHLWTEGISASIVLPSPYKDLAEMPLEERKRILC